jgi:hypothetical protein
VLREISARTKESTTDTSSAISKLSELASQLRRTVSGFTLPNDTSATGILRQGPLPENLESMVGDAEPDDTSEMAAERRLLSG